MILRPATLDDTQALSRLGRETFCAAFEHMYEPADLDAFLQQVYSEDSVRQEIEDNHCIHRLAEDESGLLGFVKLRHPSWYEDDSDAANPIALGQLYTRTDRIGEGIGAALMDWAMGEARERGHDAIQLSVWSGNHGAQRFYARYGFEKIANIDFWVGNQRDDEFLYEVRLEGEDE